MREESLLYWGMVVTGFLLIAALITARDLFEMYIETRANEAGDPAQPASRKPPPVG